jgi:hypothetical protein
VIAHVGGVPVEETLLPLLSGVGVALLLARAWAVSRVRRPRNLADSTPVNELGAGRPYVEDGEVER